LKKASAKAECTKTEWKGRAGWRLSNGALELVALTGGGHLASLRRLNPESPNLLWEAPWRTIEPASFKASEHNHLYTPAPVGPFLSGFTGHALVLGYFGGPSEAEAKTGLPLHGEAASLTWRTISHAVSRGTVRLVMEVREPAMGLRLRREIVMQSGESVIQISERISNERDADVFFQWVQHATFGEPLLSHDDSQIAVPAVRGQTWGLGYEGKALLADNKMFRWPDAPLRSGGTADLTRVFIREGTGFVVAAQVDPAREYGFVAASNPRLRLAAGYCFPRKTYPWVALWEENAAREYSPWNHVTRCRGLEFGTSPMPLGLAHDVSSGPLLETPTLARIGAKSNMDVRYQLFATAMPERWRGVADVQMTKWGLEVIGLGGRESLRLGGVPQAK
jgi:hypothetical protein